jgi:serine protease Do
MIAAIMTAVLCCALALFLFAAQAQAKSAPDSFADLADRLLPSVVNISTTQVIERDPGTEEFEELFREFFERRGQVPPLPRQRRQSSLGSGFIIDSSGYIVTNHHVIEGADEISVRLQDNTVLDATLVGSDDKTDLALLKVEHDGELPAVPWGNSDDVRVGDWIVAIGNPFGLGGTVTAGIISARQRDINSGPYDDFLQTDASINRGNSGGPMFDLEGRVIGVNTAIFSPSGGSIGIGFAIPSAMARNVIDNLRQFGEVPRGWLGVRIQTVTEELAEGLRLPEATGALVASVTDDGPAEKAGIKQGDVILEFDGREVEEMRRLPRMVAETRVGADVEVVIWRKGKRETLQVSLGKLDDATLAAAIGDAPEPASEGSNEDLGLTLSSLSPELRERFELADDVEGVVVIEVDPEGAAADKGVRPGDVIEEVDQEEVSDPSDVVRQVKAAKSMDYQVVTLLILRGGEHQWVAVRLGSP